MSVVASIRRLQAASMLAKESVFSKDGRFNPYAFKAFQDAQKQLTQLYTNDVDEAV
jgi:hypothetical protein